MLAAHAAALELRKKLACCGLADARPRQLVDRERSEVGERHLAPHQQRNHLLGVADALEPAHPRSQLGCSLVEQRVPAERMAAFGRVARGGAHCLGRLCLARRSSHEKAVSARVLVLPVRADATATALFALAPLPAVWADVTSSALFALLLVSPVCAEAAATALLAAAPLLLMQADATATALFTLILPPPV